MASLNCGLSEWPGMLSGKEGGGACWDGAQEEEQCFSPGPGSGGAQAWRGCWSEGPWPLSLFPVNGASELLSDSEGTGHGPGHGGPGSTPPEDQHGVNASDPWARPQALSPSAPPWRKRRGEERTLRSSAEEGSLWGWGPGPHGITYWIKVRAPP